MLPIYVSNKQKEGKYKISQNSKRSARLQKS